MTGAVAQVRRKELKVPAKHMWPRTAATPPPTAGAVGRQAHPQCLCWCGTHLTGEKGQQEEKETMAGSLWLHKSLGRRDLAQ